MKLSKEEIKKIGLSLIGLIALTYCFFSFLLGPLQKNQANMTATTAELEGKLTQGKKAIQQMSAIEKSAAAAVAQSNEIKAMIPEGAPIAWLPPRIKSAFASEGLEIGIVRLLNSFPMKQPELSDFALNEWSVDFVQADFLTLAQSIARLENQNPLWSVVSVRVRAGLADPAVQSATLGLQTIVKK